MNLIKESITTSVQVFPTASTGISSSALLEASDYRNVLLKGLFHRLPDAAGEGVTTMTVWESTASTWNGAVATQITAKAVTGSLTSVSDIFLQTEVRTAEMSANVVGKKYIGARLTPPTSSNVALTVERGQGRFDPQV